MNNKVESEMYGKAFKNNALTMYMFKSSRRNSKCSNGINVNHLISKNLYIHDDRIISQFVGTIESVVYNAKQFNNHLELSAYYTLGKNSSYKNANNNLFCGTEYNSFNMQRVQFESIEQCINFVYGLYCLIYPYNEISLENDIYNNASVKHFINMYYDRK